MYLKSLEIQGFKSFANKIVFDYHNGITGIVGPNGSGKSNVADAVRWVLGEQSAKQLRGASMQDVIFAGTENRKPLSYAYVAITLDNSDHQLAIDYEEVTIARRVYRSGESEYLINGTPCRLKEVSELFYDTGIGKEGYSIIGQGQIDRILSGKPEDRRELFDEAAGIVKFKKRKVTTQKKLEDERENLVRVNDILAELERQVGPLERQSAKAKEYLKLRDEQKEYDVNMFLLEMNRLDSEKVEVESKYAIASAEMEETNEAYTNIKTEYETLERAIEDMNAKVESIRENMSNTSVTREKLESQIQVLKEQIHTAETSEEHYTSRLEAIEKEKTIRAQSRQIYDDKKAEQDAELATLTEQQTKAKGELDAIRAEILRCNTELDEGQAELMALLNNKSSIQAREQRYETMLEQINIRKAELSKRLLNRKTQENDLNTVLAGYEKELADVNEALIALKEKENAFSEEEKSLRERRSKAQAEYEKAQSAYHEYKSKLETMRNIAERYDGYGNSIRKVMEQKSSNKGICGVVSDLIQVEKKYEIAIETALGGNIQNIVTEDEETAKRMITFLKENRLGRATFLPLTSVSAKTNPRNEAAMGETGVIGLASDLITCESKYKEVAGYLLGRVLVVDHIDHAIALARKNHFTLHIVTLEGEYLSPGGSMTGGAFKNTTNLLARNREIEELEKKLAEVEGRIETLKKEREEVAGLLAANADSLETVRAELQEKYIIQNTAKLNVNRANQEKNESETAYAGLMTESNDIENQINDINLNKQKIKDEISDAKKREEEIEAKKKTLTAALEEQKALEPKAASAVNKIAVEISKLNANIEFTMENMDRINSELTRFDEERDSIHLEAENAKADVEKKKHEIDEINATIIASEDASGKLSEELKESLEKRDAMNVEHKGFFQKQEDLSKKLNDLDKEIFRLNNQREKLAESSEYQMNYMWETYELTPHAAEELRKEEYTDLAALKKMISEIKEAIRRLGDVNVNAIEEYREVSERYQFLKTQHDDLVEAEKTLIDIIDELDRGMRKQFTEKFAEIQREFDKTFKQLFGGGHGTLELVEDEDILESGIRIIAQPPGKKLQNMMQLSGGEKALTAIALLFAIQALKPSPFCLLDEIEAALDDSNVSRFANYLKKLTSNTQFIVITHRRGTMTAADRLYGITMQEKGVSTLVSVNLIENDLSE